MKKLFPLFLVFTAIAIATVTRFYLLGIAPAGLYLDEAGQGYSAYSILKTGKDEFGKAFPIVFRSFTDFKTPIYIYLIVPLINIFGLTKFTVRFPSFFFSILTFPILYFLIKEITDKKISTVVAVTTSFLFAISPWHILFGRTNFECNVALFFFLTGVLLFYKALKRPYLLMLSAVFFAIAIPAYHAQRIITPLMLLALFFRYKSTLLTKTHFKYLIIGCILGLIISLPTLSIANSSGFLARASGLNIVSHSRQKPAGYLEDYQGLLSPIVNSSLLLTTREFLALYLSYFSPRNMFILGDSGLRSSFPELSTFFLWQFPFYIYGLYLLVKRKDLGELKFFTLALLLISPLPASLTRDPYSTIRSLQMVIPQNLVIGLAIADVYHRLTKTKKLIFYTVSLLVIIYSLAKLYSSVIVLNEYYRGQLWNYGWEEAIQTINTLNKNLPIIVDNSRDEPYIHLLFFLKYDPAKYQQDNNEVKESEYYTNMANDKEKQIGMIVTRSINWEKDLLQEQYLIGDELAISVGQIKEHNLTLIKEIKYPDGNVALRITKTNP